MENPKVSVVICHHTGDLVYRCLNSLKDAQAQIIVVTTCENYKKPFPHISALHLIPQLNSPTFKRNQGAILARGEYLVFMDDDVEAEPNCIANMTAYLDANLGVGMVYATLYKMDNHNIVDTSGSFLSWNGFLYETYTKRENPACILAGKSALCMIRADLFRKIGGFDEDFVIYGEETDLSWRVWLAGYIVMVLPSAIGYHAFETALKPRSYYNQRYIHYHGCKNYITMLIKNLPASRLHIVFINAALWFIMSCALWFRSRQGARWIWQGLWYNIKNFMYVWRKRKNIARTKYPFGTICKSPELSYYWNRFIGYLTHRLHG